MARFVVKSGDFQTVVEGTRAIPAAARALAWIDRKIKLGPRVEVVPFGGSGVTGALRLETGTLLSMLAEHDLA